MPKKRAERKVDPLLQKLDRGRTLLAAWGIHEGSLPPGAPAQQVIDGLAPLIGRDAACDLVIAEWLGGLTDPAAAERLAAWEATADKDLKREIRRSLFRLEQKGIRVARPEEPKPSFTLREERLEPEGYLGPVDGEGGRMAWLVRREGGRASGLFSVVSDIDGMILLDTGKMTAANLARALQEREEKGHTKLVKAPWNYVDAVMHAAFRKSPPRPGNMRGEYLLDRAEIITPEEPAGLPVCPIREILRLDDASVPALLDTSARLFEEKAFSSWAVPHEVARPHLQAFINMSESGLVLSKEASADRVTSLMDTALDDFVAGEARPLYVRRFEEMAYFFHLRESDDPARICLAVASALAAPEGRRMKEISFLRIFVFRAFLPLMAARSRSAQEA